MLMIIWKNKLARACKGGSENKRDERKCALCDNKTSIKLVQTMQSNSRCVDK